MTPETRPLLPLMQTFETAAIDVTKAYRLLTHVVAPRPIAFVSTQSRAGIRNLAPFSFFMAGGANPPSVIFSPVSGRSGIPKDTLRNVSETGEYVINVVDYAMREGMNQACFAYPPEESEWPHTGFTPVPSRAVAPPRVAESPMALECRLHTIVPHGNGPLAANYIIGEVLFFHIADALLDERGDIDARRVDYINRMGADWYSRATPEAIFELKRPEKG